MATTWTPERRAQQAAQIHTWRPWERSTGPKTPAGKAASANNAFKGGHGAKLRALTKAVNAVLREQREQPGREAASRGAGAAYERRSA
jgi:hypothetical protein